MLRRSGCLVFFSGCFAERVLQNKLDIESFAWMLKDKIIFWYLSRYARERSLHCMAMCHSRGVRLVLLIVMSLFKGAFSSLYGDIATFSSKSFDGAFASSIDSYVAMQGSVRFFVWRCISRRSVRLVDWFVCRYARELSLLCMAMYHSTKRSLRWLIYMSLCKGAFASLYNDVDNTFSIVSFDEAFAPLIDFYVAMQGSVRSVCMAM
jgi:hypothetical protein